MHTPFVDSFISKDFFIIDFQRDCWIDGSVKETAKR